MELEKTIDVKNKLGSKADDGCFSDTELYHQFVDSFSTNYLVLVEDSLQA